MSRLGTRKQRAQQLMQRLEEGPALLFLGRYSAEETKEHVMAWLGSWITPNVKDLVPELREKKAPK